MIGGPRDLTTTQQCISGLCNILESQGLGIQKHLMLPGPPPSTLDFGCEIAKQLVRWDRILQPYFVTTISLLSVCVLNCEITAKKVGEDVSVVGG
jgi:hypothetical protein